MSELEPGSPPSAPEDGEVDDVQADPHDDPSAEVLDGEDAPLNLEGAPEEMQ